MNPFQWLTLPALGLAFLADCVAMVRGRPAFRKDRVFRAAVWAAAFAAIAEPDLTSVAAHLLGITRGTDLVLYLMALSFLVAAFTLYTKLIRLQRQMTDLVRHLAIQEARRGAPPGG